MFWSKIWYFLITVAAAIAVVVALAVPKPAERRSVADQNRRIKDACSVINILLTKRAGMRVNKAMYYSVIPTLGSTLQNASRPAPISSELNRTARETARRHIFKAEGAKQDPLKPDFVMFLDKNGRVVARVTGGAKVPGIDTAEYGDSLAGYSLIEDALAGFVRDDLWQIKGVMYRMAIAPVIRNGYRVGTVVTGHEVDQEFAKSLADNLGVKISFYAGERAVANSDPEALIDKDVVAAVKARGSLKESRDKDCLLEPIHVQAGANKSFLVAAARLPGEAGVVQKAFYAVFFERFAPIGIGAIEDKDLALGSFPWPAVGGLFLLAIGLGFGIMVWETDRPLRRLVRDALALSKGTIRRIDEDAHRGKFGSIARSVNIQLDKQDQATKAAKSDLDQLLGPVGEDSPMGAFEAPEPSALPQVGPGTSLDAFAAPPPSEFKFADAPSPMNSGEFEFDLPAPASVPDIEVPKSERSGPLQAAPAADRSGPLQAAPTHDHVAPAPIRIEPSKSGAVSGSAIDEDILGRPTTEQGEFDSERTVIADPSQDLLDASATNGEDGFRKVFDDFVALKRKCGESTDSLTLAKFVAKLEKNRATLMAKHDCKDVRFQVYIKAGKAALRATPVK